MISRFAAGEFDVLVSTTVIEVGIDVPNATVMIVEDAERFGLAQLHQLRGRVGRGEHASYCALISSAEGADAEARLNVLEETNNGFVLAEKDLELRGPGDFLGKRQSGLPDFRVWRTWAMCRPWLWREAAQKLFVGSGAIRSPRGGPRAALLAVRRRQLSCGERNGGVCLVLAGAAALLS